MISVRHLSKTYTTPTGESFQVLKDVNCDIDKGEVISIIGPSGTGKSTFLRALNLLDPPTGGEILVDGENILEKGYPMNRLRQRMGMVFQSFNLFDHLTILQNVTLAPIKLLKKSKQDAEAEAIQLLRKVGMAEKANVYPASLRHQMELLPHRAFCNYIFFSLDLKVCPVQLFLINTHF